MVMALIRGRNSVLGYTLFVAVVGALMSMTAAAQTGGGKPLSLHPDNPHYFLWRGEPTVLITSGEHYGAVVNLDFDYKTYLQTLKKDGLNHTRTWVGTYREVPSSFGITENTLAPLPGRYICPWSRSAKPGCFDGGNKFDLTKWDEAYFKRLKDFMSVAGRCGVVVELNLFCPNYNEELWKASPMNAANNVNGVGNCGRTETYTLKHKDLLAVQQAVVRKVVSELRGFDNLYYEVCNEPYFGGVTLEWQHRMVDTIVDSERDFPHKHLISMNIANGRKKIERPHAAVSIFNFHYCIPPDTVAMNYGLNKVIGENETGFRGRENEKYRTEGWDFIFAGGAIYNNLDYSFKRTNATGTFLAYKSPGGGNPRLRKQLSILKAFIDGLDFIQLRPHNEIVKKVTNAGLSVRVLAAPGRQYAVYIHEPLKKGSNPRKGLTTGLELELQNGDYRGEWLDTKTGTVVRREHFRHPGGLRKLASPPFDVDIALRIRTNGP